MFVRCRGNHPYQRKHRASRTKAAESEWLAKYKGLIQHLRAAHEMQTKGWQWHKGSDTYVGGTHMRFGSSSSPLSDFIVLLPHCTIESNRASCVCPLTSLFTAKAKKHLDGSAFVRLSTLFTSLMLTHCTPAVFRMPPPVSQQLPLTMYVRCRGTHPSQRKRRADRAVAACVDSIQSKCLLERSDALFSRRGRRRSVMY